MGSSLSFLLSLLQTFFAAPAMLLAQPMQALDDKLSNAWSVISHLNGVMNNDELRKVYKNCLEKLTEYSTEVSQNAALCDAYKKLAERDDFKKKLMQYRYFLRNW